MSSMSCETEIIAVLRLHQSGGGNRSIELREGDRLFVGSDENSEICLAGDDVASTHCEISASSGRVFVRDCYSNVGTVVNGNPIRELQLAGDSDIGIGGARISVNMHRRSAPVSTVTSGSGPDSNSGSGDERRDLPPDAGSHERVASEFQDRAAEGGEGQTPFELIEELQLKLAQVETENQVLQDRLSNTAAAVVTSGGDPYQEEMIELLRAEVLELQAVLAEQEHSSGDQTDEAAASPDTVNSLPQAEAEQLVDRLEQLLQELQLKDEQVATLTELLDVAEDTNRAEQEERDQLNAWLRDIEERFGAREQEWKAQREQLEQSVETITAERDRLESAINADSASAKLEAAQKLLMNLRQTAEEQRKQLVKSEETVRSLREQLEQAEQSKSREDQVRLAEERAELARQWQELEAARQQQLRAVPQEAALKIQALRQHLQEIHSQEMQEKEGRKLSSRIAKLWGRLDGRS